MRRLVIGLMSAVLLTACSSTGSETRSTTTEKSTASTTDPNNPYGCPPEDGINYGCPTGPIDSVPEPDYNLLNKKCERVRSKNPIPAKLDDFDSPGVLTTSMDYDSQGNTIITGLMSDENDFDITNGRRTVGVSGWNFTFIAKFNKKSEFVWIKCLGVSSLFHWYIGPTVNTDSAGNIYHCDGGLTKFSPEGNELWYASTGEASISCMTDTSGNTFIAGPIGAYVNTEGKTIWSLKYCQCSAATFDRDGNVFVGSRYGLEKLSAQGKSQWAIGFRARHNESFGPDGLSEFGSGSYVTDQVGLRTDKNNNIVFILSLNLKNDFDPSPNSFVLKPGWLQDVAVAKYSTSGKLIWAKKVKLPKETPTTRRYAEGYDVSFMPNGDIIALGGGNIDNGPSAWSHLFLAKFTSKGQQTRFLWLDQYESWIHNLGHHVITNKNGRTYVTAKGEILPPFLISRDM